MKTSHKTELALAASIVAWNAGNRSDAAALIGQAIPAKAMEMVAFRVGETEYADSAQLGMAIVEIAEWTRNMGKGEPTPADILRGYFQRESEGRGFTLDGQPTV